MLKAIFLPFIAKIHFIVTLAYMCLIGNHTYFTFGNHITCHCFLFFLYWQISCIVGIILDLLIFSLAENCLSGNHTSFFHVYLADNRLISNCTPSLGFKMAGVVILVTITHLFIFTLTDRSLIGNQTLSPFYYQG